MKTTKILLADDHKIMVDGLRTLIEKQPGLEVVGMAADGAQAVEMAEELKPDVVIMDIGMPNVNGIDATRQIVARVPNARVIALSMHSDKRFVSEMFKAGAAGYLLKDCAFEEVENAIRTVLAKRAYLSPSIAGVVMEDYVSRLPREATEGLNVLTPKERGVLQLLAEGKTTKEISRRLKVSPKTVETHRAHIMAKLDLHSVAELTKYAVREGLTGLE